MTVARTVGDVLRDHVTLEVECVDRLYLNVYQPRLQYVNGVVWFFRGHRGASFASSALMDPITKEFVASVHRFARDTGVPLVDLARGQRKDDVAHEYLAGFDAAGHDEGVLFVGRAQEKTALLRTEKRRNPVTGASYPWIVRSTGVVNHFYFYCVDSDFGPFFLKFCSYFPYNAKLCVNGNEWAKRQATKARIEFTALDNGFAACADPAGLQKICDRLSPAKIDALLRKWLARLPHPFTGADRAAGYRYDVSVLQAEFSLTQMLDRPLSGRVLFEEVIRENLDIGRPDKVGLIFDRQIRRRGKHPIPGRWRTRVLTAGVTPGSPRATTSTTRSSSTTRKGVRCALRLRRPSMTAGTSVSGNGCATCPPWRQSASPPTGVCWTSNVSPPTPPSATARSGPSPMRWSWAPNAPQLCRSTPPAPRPCSPPWSCSACCPRVPQQCPPRHLAPLLGLDPSRMTQGRMSYDLRRLRLHGLIERLPGTHRYTVTDRGLRTAIFLTRGLGVPHRRVSRRQALARGCRFLSRRRGPEVGGCCHNSGHASLTDAADGGSSCGVTTATLDTDCLDARPPRCT
jgi:hypothetical protein